MRDKEDFVRHSTEERLDGEDEEERDTQGSNNAHLPMDGKSDVSAPAGARDARRYVHVEVMDRVVTVERDDDTSSDGVNPAEDRTRPRRGSMEEVELLVGDSSHVWLYVRFTISALGPQSGTEVKHAQEMTWFLEARPTIRGI